MPETLSLTSFLIVGAVGTYVLGFLFRSPIYIRLLVFIGSLFYACYYWIAGPEPLWDAIIGSALIALASAQGVVRLYWSKQPSSVRRENRDVFAVMPAMEPGLFNSLMKIGNRMTVQTPTILTREGAPADALWFFVTGELTLETASHDSIRITKPGFIGDIAWMLKDTATATVIAQPGSELVRWDSASLATATRKNHRLELALEAALAFDIAHKLSRSRPMDEPVLPFEPAAAGALSEAKL